jgi:hypothetical protein
MKMQSEGYTKEEVSEAYGKLIWAQGLIDFVLHAGFDLDSGNTAKQEGSLISIFSILQNYLKKASEIMDNLDMGYEDKFSAIWKKKESDK